MKPYLVDETKSPKLDVIDKTDPEPMPNQPAISPAAARDLTQMMVSVVENGTAKHGRDPRSRGRRQDRNGAELARPAAVRLVRVLRSRRDPCRRGRRARAGRRRRP